MIALIMVVGSITMTYASQTSFFGEDCSVFNSTFNIRACNDLNDLNDRVIELESGATTKQMEISFGPGGDAYCNEIIFAAQMELKPFGGSVIFHEDPDNPTDFTIEKSEFVNQNFLRISADSTFVEIDESGSFEIRGFIDSVNNQNPEADVCLTLPSDFVMTGTCNAIDELVEFTSNTNPGLLLNFTNSQTVCVP